MKFLDDKFVCNTPEDDTSWIYEDEDSSVDNPEELAPDEAEFIKLLKMGVQK